MTIADVTPAMIEAASEAVYDFLHERFPEGAMPGGRQFFANDHLDAEFKHEAGCEALARAVLTAAMHAARTDPSTVEKLELAKEALEREIERLKVENDRLSRAVCSGVLGGLLTEDEGEALVAFVKQLRESAAFAKINGSEQR